MWLDEIASAAILTGLHPDGAADVIAVRWIAGNAVKVAYRVNGASRSRLLTRSNEALLSTTAPKETQLAFDEGGASFRLASEPSPLGSLTRLTPILLTRVAQRREPTAPNYGPMRRDDVAPAGMVTLEFDRLPARPAALRRLQPLISKGDL